MSRWGKERFTGFQSISKTVWLVLLVPGWGDSVAHELVVDDPKRPCVIDVKSPSPAAPCKSLLADILASFRLALTDSPVS